MAQSRLTQRWEYISRSAAATRRLGRRLAGCLRPGDVVCLVGDLGAGKTTFVQGLAAGLGVRDPATSPTFVLVHEYRGRIPLFHLDLYRLSGDLTEIGLDDILGGDAAVVVEWAERMPGHLCESAIEIDFDFDASSSTGRRIVVRASGERGQNVLRELERERNARPRD
jgi:tRNA threonylcarbamoyladenosine biosynthesis protein TsaE